MSNESNREARTISPSELQASDFFPPGHGWNQEEEDTLQSSPRKPQRECIDEEVGIDGSRPH